jgi:hypothetical protein
MSPTVLPSAIGRTHSAPFAPFTTIEESWPIVLPAFVHSLAIVASEAIVVFSIGSRPALIEAARVGFSWPLIIVIAILLLRSTIIFVVFGSLMKSGTVPTGITVIAATIIIPATSEAAASPVVTSSVITALIDASALAGVRVHAALTHSGVVIRKVFISSTLMIRAVYTTWITIPIARPTATELTAIPEFVSHAPIGVSVKFISLHALHINRMGWSLWPPHYVHQFCPPL